MGSYLHKFLFLGFWFLWTAIHAFVLSEWGYTAQEAWGDSLISNLWLAAVCVSVTYSFRYYLPLRERVTYLLLLSVLFVLVWNMAVRYTIPFLGNDVFIAHFNDSLHLRTAIAWLIVICVIMVNVLWYSQEEQKEQERRNNETERMAKDAELFKLRQQLQPHFLFNSLNSISALVVSDPAAARAMVHQLSDYLRNTLRKEEHKWVTLAEELEYLQLYLGIERVRFGHRLLVSVDSSDLSLPMKLPPLLLQPIVENAIKFGLYDTTDEVSIEIAASANENMLVITVQNPFDPATTSPKGGTGFGLTSVRRRLHLLFGRSDLLIAEGVGNIFTTTIKVPQL